MLLRMRDEDEAFTVHIVIACFMLYMMSDTTVILFTRMQYVH